MDTANKENDNSEQKDNFFIVKSDPDVREFVDNILKDATEE